MPTSDPPRSSFVGSCRGYGGTDSCHKERSEQANGRNDGDQESHDMEQVHAMLEMVVKVDRRHECGVKTVGDVVSEQDTIMSFAGI